MALIFPSACFRVEISAISFAFAYKPCTSNCRLTSRRHLKFGTSQRKPESSADVYFPQIFPIHGHGTNIYPKAQARSQSKARTQISAIFLIAVNSPQPVRQQGLPRPPPKQLQNVPQVWHLCCATFVFATVTLPAGLSCENIT